MLVHFDILFGRDLFRKNISKSHNGEAHYWLYDYANKQNWHIGRVENVLKILQVIKNEEFLLLIA